MPARRVWVAHLGLNQLKASNLVKSLFYLCCSLGFSSFPRLSSDLTLGCPQDLPGSSLGFLPFCSQVFPGFSSSPRFSLVVNRTDKIRTDGTMHFLKNSHPSAPIRREISRTKTNVNIGSPRKKTGSDPWSTTWKI